ncbi:related to mouse KIN17 [Lecanosticta acicola]|uniref:Related to mouse KIN17 n=1 Tax=Lecanosticta acicola TaxID=111012 RepID=A0AAI8YSZ6_9PEZI|nr:related to mouse KIN17 [Lecanosticta acicola]
MPKAEIGSTKHLANKMKAKGLQRLRWYCQVCGKQCRDENGFKQHTMSEGHVRQMQLVGEDPKKYINEFSRQFQRDFLQLLKTAHGEKKVNMNNFYQEYIKDKEHVHMNATKWPSLTEFAKFLGREGICRVDEGERGLEVQWIDDSAEAIRRREDIKKKDRLVKGDEDVESRLLAQQVKRAREEAERMGRTEPPPTLAENEGEAEVERKPLEPVKLSGFSLKSKGPVKPVEEKSQDESAPIAIETFSSTDNPAEQPQPAKPSPPKDNDEEDNEEVPKPEAPPKISLGGLKKKPGNPLAKKNPFAKPKPTAVAEPEKKMSNAERIMKEELERKRLMDQRGHGNKRQRLA